MTSVWMLLSAFSALLVIPNAAELPVESLAAVLLASLGRLRRPEVLQQLPASAAINADGTACTGLQLEVLATA